MVGLDCENFKNALGSLSSIYRIPAIEIVELLKSFEGEDRCFYDNLNAYIDRNLGTPNELSYVYWFHGTRTARGNNFSNGILPLSGARPIIWSELLQLFDDQLVLDRLENLRANDPGCQAKCFSPQEHDGPNGFLIKDVLLLNNMVGAGDFLDIPEYIEEICSAYRDSFNDCIKNIVCKAFVAKIVKFKCLPPTLKEQKRLIKFAISYVYCCVRACVRAWAAASWCGHGR